MFVIKLLTCSLISIGVNYLDITIVSFLISRNGIVYEKNLTFRYKYYDLYVVFNYYDSSFVKIIICPSTGYQKKKVCIFLHKHLYLHFRSFYVNNFVLRFANYSRRSRSDCNAKFTIIVTARGEMFVE